MSLEWSTLRESQDTKALPLRRSKHSSCDMTQKVTTTAADNGSSFVKTSGKLHADLAPVVYFTNVKFPHTQIDVSSSQLSLGKKCLYFTKGHSLLYCRVALKQELAPLGWSKIILRPKRSEIKIDAPHLMNVMVYCSNQIWKANTTDQQYFRKRSLYVVLIYFSIVIQKLQKTHIYTCSLCVNPNNKTPSGMLHRSDRVPSSQLRQNLSTFISALQNSD